MSEKHGNNKKKMASWPEHAQHVPRQHDHDGIIIDGPHWSHSCQVTSWIWTPPAVVVSSVHPHMSQPSDHITHICEGVHWIQQQLLVESRSRMLGGQKSSPNCSSHHHIISPWDLLWHMMCVNWNVTSHDPMWKTNLSQFRDLNVYLGLGL